jgi:adenine phosphoribosyltransferase
MLLEQVYNGAPAVHSGRHLTTVNEFTDQIPALRRELLSEATERLLALGPVDGATKLLVEEDKGAILGAALCLATGLPLAVARWYSYPLAASGLRAPIAVKLDSEYFAGTLYVNGIASGDRVAIIDDTISTGGTLCALIRAVQQAGAEVSEVRVVVEKVSNGGAQRIEAEFNIPVRSVIKIDVDSSTRRSHVVPK